MPISDKLFQISKLPPEDIARAVLLLAEEQAKDEHRLLMQRNRTQKCREKRYGNVTVTDRYGNGLDNPDRYGNVTVTASIISKKVSKNNILNIRGASKRKRSTIPIDLIMVQRNVDDAIKIGVPQELIATEWSKFIDHHLLKGTLGADWNAGWRRWCQNHVEWATKRATPSAKPLNQYQQKLQEKEEILASLRQHADTIPGQDAATRSLALDPPTDQQLPSIDPHQGIHGDVGCAIVPLRKIGGDLGPVPSFWDRDEIQQATESRRNQI
jgi:hypothetical protein